MEPSNVEEGGETKGSNIMLLLVCGLVLVVYELDATQIAANAKPLSEHFALTLSGIGILMGVRAVVQAGLMPVWGYLADRKSRKVLLLLACVLWGLDSVATALCQTYQQLLIVRGFAGVGLAAVLPVVHSLVTDVVPVANRGAAFGGLGLAQMIGGVAGVMFATNVSSIRHNIMWMTAWRFTFVVTGLVSLLVGVAVLLFVFDPLRGGSEEGQEGQDGHGHGTDYDEEEALPFTKVASNLFTNKTFFLIFLRSSFDGIPANANTLLILWFEYLGFSEGRSSTIVSVMMVSAAISSAAGGFVGDWAYTKNKNHGRIITAESGVCIQIIMTLLFFKALPLPVMAGGEQPLGVAFWMFCVCGFFMQIVGNWDQQACDLPLLSEVVEPRLRGTAFGICDCAQCLFSFFATAFVGVMAEQAFGFVAEGTKPIHTWPMQERVGNSLALGNALLWTNIFALGGSFVCYLLMHVTYPSDRKAMVDKISGKAPDEEHAGLLEE
jgi:MFS family permease